MLFRTANITQLSNFDNVIDVRSPSEYAEDHLPFALNFPVLDDKERAEVGVLYKQSAFDARRLGATLISRRIANFLENEFSLHGRNWRPLIYCSRGGMRSGAMAIILSQVGWQVHQLIGGYKAYRQQVLQQLPALVEQCTLRVVCAPTGSGKSHFLAALKRAGKQVLDLENMASHRGSVLGNLPGEPQPSQRKFDSRLLYELQNFDFSKPIFIESESRRIGNISLPDALYEKMHQSQCLFLEVAKEERIRFLCDDYSFYVQDPELLIRQLSFLSRVHSVEQIMEWNALARAKQFEDLVGQMLNLHYDPLYWRSMRKHYPQLDLAQKITLPSLAFHALEAAVKQVHD